MTFYFDNAATTKIKPEVVSAMKPYLTEDYGNPSALYTLGRRAKKAIEESRTKVASLINCEKSEIYFTGCGTESDNTALLGIAKAYKNKGKHIITSKIEHNAILNTCKMLEKDGYEITYLNVDKEGIIDLQELENAVRDDTILISIMFANNEVGTIQPIKQIARIAKKHNVLFHTDAVQAVGNVPIDVKNVKNMEIEEKDAENVLIEAKNVGNMSIEVKKSEKALLDGKEVESSPIYVKEIGIDLLSMSGHKLHAPKGIGALYVKKGIEFEKYMNGGHQEKNKRAGTENVAGIVGFGKACEIAKKNLYLHMGYVRYLRDYYITKVIENIPYVKINGSLNYRLPGNANISFLGVDSTALLLELDKKCICCSAGSACNSGESSPSHVLTAMKVDEECSRSALRVTFGDYNTIEEVDYLVLNLAECVYKLRQTN